MSDRTIGNSMFTRMGRLLLGAACIAALPILWKGSRAFVRWLNKLPNRIETHDQYGKTMLAAVWMGLLIILAIALHERRAGVATVCQAHRATIVLAIVSILCTPFVFVGSFCNWFLLPSAAAIHAAVLLRVAWIAFRGDGHLPQLGLWAAASFAVCTLAIACALLSEKMLALGWAKAMD